MLKTGTFLQQKAVVFYDTPKKILRKQYICTYAKTKREKELYKLGMHTNNFHQETKGDGLYSD